MCGRIVPAGFLLGLLFWAPAAFPQHSVPASVYQHIDADLQEGHLADAEAELRAALKSYPHDSHALGMLGVVLDAEKKYQQAEVCYREALRVDPRSPSLLNNVGNHYLSQGDVARARRAYLDVVALDPRHLNANLQLATISVGTGRGQQALHYLGELPAAAAEQPAVKLLRARALHLAGESAEADRLLAGLQKETGNDPRVAFSVGMVEAQWKEYRQAEQSLRRALDADPANPDITYNLGLCALNAGDFGTAQRMLDVALSQRPDDVDTLYSLARLDAKRKYNDQAIVRLVRAHHLAPRRSDVLVLMGHVAEELGYYGDAAEAFQQDLKLEPRNELIRREYGFALAHTPQIGRAVSVLQAYVTRHPKDARGLYDLGVAETVRFQPAAIRNLKRAISLDPQMTAASYALAAVLDQEVHLRQALSILEPLTRQDPHDYRALELLGQIELQLQQPAKAVQALSRAAALAPQNRRVLIQYSQALERAQRREQALAVLKRYQDLPPEEPRPYSGLLYYLSLPASAQKSQYLERLRRDVQLNPLDTDLELRWGKALLDDRKTGEALGVFDRLLAQRPGVNVLKDAANTLLGYAEYQEAQKLLQRIIADGPAGPGDVLNLSIALFHTSGPAPALAELDQTPPSARQGDYYLLHAQILDAMGKPRGAANDLTIALRADPTRPDLYFEAALFLLKHNQARETVALLERAVEKFPDSRQLLLTQAMTYGLMRQFEKAKPIMTRIEARWPEWSEAYLIHGIILVGQAKMKEAKPLLETAIALGTRDPFAYYNLALADVEIFPADLAGATKAIQAALKLGPNDPYTQSLAGKIAYTQKNYAVALEHLKSAIRVWPDMIEAHETLSATYRAMGERQKSIAELQSILRIKQHTRSADQASPSDLKTLLFSVPAPEFPGT